MTAEGRTNRWRTSRRARGAYLLHPPSRAARLRRDRAAKQWKKRREYTTRPQMVYASRDDESTAIPPEIDAGVGVLGRAGLRPRNPVRAATRHHSDPAKRLGHFR